jgi:hypothetical protein
VTDVWTLPLSDRRLFFARRLVAVVAGTLFLLAAAIAVAVSLVSARSDGLQQVIIGSWPGDVLATRSVVASIVFLTVLVIAVPAPRWWLLLLVPLRVVGITASLLGGVGVGLTDDSATPIVADGCETGYVVSERAFLFAASGQVLRMDGVIGSRVASTTVDDGHKPFLDRSYLAVADGDTVRVWHTVESVGAPLNTSSEPAFILPRLSYQTGCGLAGGEPQAAPQTSGPTFDADGGEGPPPSAPHDTRKQVARMAALTVESSVGTAVDAAGAPIRVPPADELSCDGTTGVELVFATADNEASYAAILGAWTASGYASDRAMQEDIRYDGTVRLSTRDRTTIDGMLHLQLGGACEVP